MPETLEEAEIILGVAHAQRKICRTKIRLADLHGEESHLRSRLYVIRAGRLKRKLDQADVQVGSARNTVRESGHWQALKGPRRPKRIKRIHG